MSRGRVSIEGLLKWHRAHLARTLMDDLNHIHTDGPFKGWSRKMVLDEIAKEYGSWTYFDEVTVIAGGQKWTVPKGKPLEAKTGSPLDGKKSYLPRGVGTRFSS